MMHQKTYESWLQDPFIDQADKEALRLMKGDEKLIEELFFRDLSFGTAGMRGKIGIGTNRINKYQVAKATQAYANHLNNKKGNCPSVVIAYDTRNQSKSFAETSARVLLANDIQVYLFKETRSVPELSFAVRYLNASGGIVITASHNPKVYNGYKLYSDYGGQLVPEDMVPIINEFDSIQSFSEIQIYQNDLRAHKKIQFIGKDVDEKYYEAILKLQMNEGIGRDVGIVYSPLHGTGITCVPEILKKSGFCNLYIVKEQSEPDKDFSTVEVPNPENKEALKMAIDLGKQQNADLIMATDPDCDRVGIAVKDKEGKYVLLNGNQIGGMLIDYLVTNQKVPADGVMIQTVVTSNFGKKIAENAGLEVLEVLTGFKYIGEKITQFENNNSKRFILGYEESYGFLSGTHARDKDAANACLLLAEMAAVYRQQGKTMYDRLNELYQTFGYYAEELHTIRFDSIDGVEQMAHILRELRQQSIHEIDGEKTNDIDYLNDDTGLPKENVLKYNMESGSWVALRPSGTEPKFKIYFSSVADSKNSAQEKCQRMKKQIIEMIESI